MRGIKYHKIVEKQVKNKVYKRCSWINPGASFECGVVHHCNQFKESKSSITKFLLILNVDIEMLG